MDPIELIEHDRAEARKLDDANADICFLALASPEGKASVRTLVLRDVKGVRFQVFMNQTSPKWQLLSAGADYELLLWYPTQHHQYRVRGIAEPLDAEFVVKSWARRPKGSKYLDHVYQTHPQSSAIDSREVLIADIERIKARGAVEDLSAPSSAAGFNLVAAEIERLDLERTDRIHDRRLFIRQGDAWQQTVLVP